VLERDDDAAGRADRAGLRVIVPVGTPATPAPTARLLSVQALGNLAEIAGGIDAGPYGDDA